MLFLWTDPVSLNLLPTSSVIVCKIHFVVLQYLSLFSYTCMCMAAIDQFLSMTRYRHWNSRRLACYHVAFASIALFLIVAVQLFFKTSNGTKCIITNGTYARYHIYFYIPIFLAILPSTVISVFTLLALYKILTNTDRQLNVAHVNRDRQLTAMVLVHAFVLILSSMPFAVFYMYTWSING